MGAGSSSSSSVNVSSSDASSNSYSCSLCMFWIASCNALRFISTSTSSPSAWRLERCSPSFSANPSVAARGMSSATSSGSSPSAKDSSVGSSCSGSVPNSPSPRSSCSNNWLNVSLTSCAYLSITVVSAVLSAASLSAFASTMASFNKLDINVLLEITINQNK